MSEKVKAAISGSRQGILLRAVPCSGTMDKKIGQDSIVAKIPTQQIMSYHKPRHTKMSLASRESLGISMTAH
jgi:hypothetical protein